MPGWLKALIIVGGIVLVLGVLVVGCVAIVARTATEGAKDLGEAIENSFGEADQDDFDAKIDECTVSPGGSLAEGTLKNTAGRRQGFLITIEFLDGDDAVVATGTDVVSLSDGQTGKWTVRPATLAEIESCDIGSVNYSLFTN